MSDATTATGTANVPIIDAHHHIWRLAELPWMQGRPVKRIFGDYSKLKYDYFAEQYMADVVPQGVVKSVYIQVNVMPDQEIEEAAWVQSEADKHGFPHAVAAFANLSSAGVSDTLDKLAACCNLKSIRQQLHWHEKPEYRFAARPDIMNDADWRRGLKEVERRGLNFELQVFSHQMADAVRLAQDFPGITFILQHAGMLEDKSEPGWAAWRAGMKGLAGCPNVVSKLSGLSTFEHVCSEAVWRPVVEETVAIFGAGRCLFGSNFPIERMWSTYAQQIQTMSACLSGCSVGERRAVLHDNAARIYGL